MSSVGVTERTVRVTASGRSATRRLLRCERSWEVGIGAMLCCRHLQKTRTTTQVRTRIEIRIHEVAVGNGESWRRLQDQSTRVLQLRTRLGACISWRFRWCDSQKKHSWISGKKQIKYKCRFCKIELAKFSFQHTKFRRFSAYEQVRSEGQTVWRGTI